MRNCWSMIRLRKQSLIIQCSKLWGETWMRISDESSPERKDYNQLHARKHEDNSMFNPWPLQLNVFRYVAVHKSRWFYSVSDSFLGAYVKSTFSPSIFIYSSPPPPQLNCTCWSPHTPVWTDFLQARLCKDHVTIPKQPQDARCLLRLIHLCNVPPLVIYHLPFSLPSQTSGDLSAAKWSKCLVWHAFPCTCLADTLLHFPFSLL